MKTSMIGLLKGRITRRSLLAAVLPTAGLSVAVADGWQSNSCPGRFRLAGTFIGSDSDGHVFNMNLIPLDPEGKTAAHRLTLLTYPEATAVTIGQFGADAFSDYVGEEVMVNSHTAKFTGLGYGIKSGNPPAIMFIDLILGTEQFTGPDTIVMTYTHSIYSPSADGLPHDENFITNVPSSPGTLKRVSVV